MRRWQAACLFGAVLIASGCSGLKQDHTIDWSSNQLYDAAKGYLDNGTYQTATDYYTKLLARYPTGTVAQQAMLDLAYTYYRDRKPEEALKQLDGFIRLYPNHPYLDYALYLKGVIEYERNVSFFDRLVPGNLSQTDPEALRRAFSAFAVLNDRFPKSEYAEDARYRMIFLRNLLAEHELNVAKYYLGTGAYVAAVNRAQEVLRNYETSPSAIYALAVLVRGYQELGQERLSEDARRVLSFNHNIDGSDKEIQRILEGDVETGPGVWDQIMIKPKI